VKTRRWICPVRPRPISAPVGADVYGLIEWEDTPILIVGRSVDSVQREAVRIFATAVDGAGDLADDDPDFVRHHPLPDPDDPDADIAGWPAALRSAQTVAWFTVLDDEVVIAR
jgi:hypothetical protein